jgi:hypothetical protein
MELIDIADYCRSLEASSNGGGFKRAVIEDLTRRRDTHCPVRQPQANPPPVPEGDEHRSAVGDRP